MEPLVSTEKIDGVCGAETGGVVGAAETAGVDAPVDDPTLIHIFISPFLFISCLTFI